MALTLMSRKFLYLPVYKYIKFIDAVLKYKWSADDVRDIYLSNPAAIHKQKMSIYLTYLGHI
jgi:hypothetical protein